MTRIIGIDPGAICCGYGVVESGAKSQKSGVRSQQSIVNSQQTSVNHNGLKYVTAGDIKLKKKDALSVRLNVLYDNLKLIIDEYRPAHLCIERIFYHKSIRSAFTLGSTRGIALLLAAQHSLPVYEYNPTEMKMALTGYGRAEKRQVQEMVKRILNIMASDNTLSEDATDALALCICHIHSSTFR